MADIEDKRPEWPFSLTEAQVRSLASCITNIAHRWEMTGNDTSRNWIEMTIDKGPTFVAPQGWTELFVFTGDHHASLIRPTYKGEKAIQRLDEIKKWEAKNSRDRAEFERLKKKFGG